MPSARLLVTLDPHDVGLFRFLLEAQDNLALFTVLDSRKALLKIMCSSGQLVECRAWLQAVARLVPLVVEEYPE